MNPDAVELDRSVPLLIVKIGAYPLHHGGVGAIRSLGRLGVPVYAITEHAFTPAALSRHLRGRVLWPTTGLEDDVRLVAELVTIGRDLGRRTRRSDPAAGRVIALPTDDEAAVLLAEHAGELEEHFVIPAVPSALPAMLADKDALARLCETHGIPVPASFLPSSVDELLDAAATIGYPVVVKNAQPWQRLRRPGVGSSTIVAGEPELRRLSRVWAATMPRVLVQELVPGGDDADWVANVYCDAESRTLVCFTGVKVRCWPPHAGVGSLLAARPNDAISAMTTDLCRKVGYCGAADLDWRRDARTGGYKLLDFNPRIGAQSQLFRNDKGVDVVRALHLDLTGRPVPDGPQVFGRGLRVEHLDVPAMAAYWRARRGLAGRGRASSRIRIPWGRTSLAWLAPDDPLPAAAMAAWSAGPAVAMMARAFTARAFRARRRRPAGTGRSRHRGCDS